MTPDTQSEILRRRTFAIISHPDAGKTTLTEQLLLWGGAIHMAGQVKAKKSKKFTTSDWMELEKQRGISVSTSVMHFTFENHVCNLLDTPGHQDFSEDTLRTLSAVDNAIMLLDAAKGVEKQTLRLFEVCKLRKIPIFTFINKMDREAMAPLDILKNMEDQLGIASYPLFWPIDSGSRFRGILHRQSKEHLAFDKYGPMEENQRQNTLDELEMLDIAGEAFNRQAFLEGRLSPVYFGSAAHNFGVKEFLQSFLQLSCPPSPKIDSEGKKRTPDSPHFSGFIFKIQANMDPKHRDRIAFLRVVSGIYHPGSTAYHHRLQRSLKLTPPQQFFANERTQMQAAYPGDIVGIYDPSLFAIGDSLSSGEVICFDNIPRFSPEHFARILTPSALKRKQLGKALEQLCQEGTVQLFRKSSDLYVGAIGTLQFDVLLFRLKAEYGLDCTLEALPYQYARWFDGDEKQGEEVEQNIDVTYVTDIYGKNLFLFKNKFYLDHLQQNYPNISLHQYAQ